MKLLYRSYFSIGGEIVVINQEKWKEDSSSSSGFLSISRTNAVSISIHSELYHHMVIFATRPSEISFGRSFTRRNFSQQQLY